MLTIDPPTLSAKINWDRPIEWSTGEEARRDQFDYVSSCSEWRRHTGDALVAVDLATGRILGCEEEDYPFIRNVPLAGDLCINTMGEVWIKSDTACVDVGGFVDASDSPSPEELDRRQLQALIDDGLTSEHVAMVHKIWKAQASNSSRIRVAYFGRRPVIEAECCAFLDDVDLWTMIEAAAAKIGAVIDVMDTRDHLSHYCPAKGSVQKSGARPDPKQPGWFFGADHGRREKQVAIQISLTDDFTDEQVAKARQELFDATDGFWAVAGVDLL